MRRRLLIAAGGAAVLLAGWLALEVAVELADDDLDFSGAS